MDVLVRLYRRVEWLVQMVNWEHFWSTIQFRYKKRNYTCQNWTNYSFGEFTERKRCIVWQKNPHCTKSTHKRGAGGGGLTQQLYLLAPFPTPFVNLWIHLLLICELGVGLLCFCTRLILKGVHRTEVLCFQLYYLILLELLDISAMSPVWTSTRKTKTSEAKSTLKSLKITCHFRFSFLCLYFVLRSLHKKIYCNGWTSGWTTMYFWI